MAVKLKGFKKRLQVNEDSKKSEDQLMIGEFIFFFPFLSFEIKGICCNDIDLDSKPLGPGSVLVGVTPSVIPLFFSFSY